jgi:hypothetical protein
MARSYICEHFYYVPELRNYCITIPANLRVDGKFAERRVS